MKIRFPVFDEALVEEIEAYLDMPYQTEIDSVQDDTELGIRYTFARGLQPSRNGAPGHRRENNYARPMFQVIVDQAFSGSGPAVENPCQCYRFDRSWACDEHGELPWDAKNRRFVRPTSAPAEESAPALSLFAQLAQGAHVNCACALCRSQRYGRPSFIDALMAEIEPERRRQLQGEWTPEPGPNERVLGIPLADLLRSARPTPRVPLDDLPRGTMRIAFDAGGPAVTYVEINGESVQGVESVRIEIEENPRDE